MYKFFIVIIIVMYSTMNIQAQYQMDILGSYNIPNSTDFKNNFQNGLGVTADIHYFFKKTGFSSSLTFGFSSFRATNNFEKKLKEENTTIFEYDYQINYYTFPLMVSANYTFFREKKFNAIASFGLGGNFMEQKKKQMGEYTSDTEKEYFNEFAIYPNLGISYAVAKDISIILKSGYNATFGTKELSYIDIKLGVIYKI